MKYFAIEQCMNKNIVGKLPQVKEEIHNCDIWDDPRFIDRFPYEKIEINPILSNAILYPTAKATDFIEDSNVGFSRSMLISDKLKTILERFNLFGIQFFSTFIIQNNTSIYGYWQSHIYLQAFQLLDFEKINFTLKSRQDDGSVVYNDVDYIKNLNDFLMCKKETKYPVELYFRNLVLKEQGFDFMFLPHFINGTGKGIISQTLKTTLENERVTGIEFRPIEISLHDWFKTERIKIYGKI